MNKHGLDKLIEELKNNPNDLDLMNHTALAYYCTPLACSDNEDMKLLEKAYKSKMTVKSATNLAWQLSVEWGEHERAEEIMDECMTLKPKSFRSYYLYGYILLTNKKYESAIELLKKH